MNQLNGKVALVTGASALRGIGRATAMRLAADGAKVVVTDRLAPTTVDNTFARLDEIAQDIRNTGADALALPLDVTDADQISSAVDRCISDFGSLDILVNNASSLAGSADFLTTTPNEWEMSYRVNVLGPMMLSQAVIPHMQKHGGGRIINIGSTGSLGAEPGFGAYTATKHALVGFTKTLAAEFGPDGILCNTVCPGYIATDMHEAANERLAAEAGESLEAVRKRRYASVALRSAGLPDDVANAVAYLASPAGQYVTGINLPVAGGVPMGI
ncbi:SDR family oxidoreductase [Leisingera sp. JC11]|uniref:SDR family NAD(P)-dependent oxidoreductase n=1 Tax=Leisingera sp. JC11 TaxID=3042469 RepID=UPI00345649C9